MKSTGIVRKIDELGRIVIPKELRRTLNIEEGDPLEIFVDGEQLILKKYEPDNECIFCRGGKFVIEFKGKKVCTNCIKGICK
ncbi:MAG: AbrB/MazE/SpoVT family DNA-binding domain-containing protein [Peptostreptococcaceae bacterium]|nr:AbrB/MazE/SpoVT family DNA-binding domain-containing protein [Peptostreptococcaceae bacterium]